MFEELPSDFSLIVDMNIRCSKRSTVSSETLKMIKYSIKANTYKIFQGPNLLPNGYVIWAEVNRETMIRIAKYNSFPSYHYEWKDGRIILILDVLFIGSQKNHNARNLLYFLRSKRVIAFVRRRYLKVNIKRFSCFNNLLHFKLGS